MSWGPRCCQQCPHRVQQPWRWLWERERTLTALLATLVDLGGVTWTWVTPVDPSSTWQRCFGVNSKGKGATCWNATHDSLSNHLLLGDLLWYSLTWPNSSAAYEIQWAHCLRGHGFRPDRRNVTLKQYMCFSVCKRNSLERVKRMGENWEALCMSKIRACTRSKKEDKITSLQGKNTSSKVHLSYF